jgi:hypothetical protein
MELNPSAHPSRQISHRLVMLPKSGFGVPGALSGIAALTMILMDHVANGFCSLRARNDLDHGSRDYA